MNNNLSSDLSTPNQVEQESPPAPIYIRKARSKDIAQIMEIEIEQFPHPWKRDYFISELTHDISFFYVAENKRTGELAGLIIYWIFGETMELHHIATAGNYKKKGIGKQLLEFMLEMAKQEQVAEVFLEVRESNTVAIGFYEAFGFQQAGVRKNYYSEPVENALIYRLEIKQGE